MLFLYDLPNWLMGVTLVSVTVVLSFIGYFLFHRFWPSACSEENKGVALAVLAVIATINSLLLAFSAVSVWDSFGNADEAVVTEANTIGSLARDLAVYNTSESLAVRSMLRQYADMVIHVEWNDMRDGQASAPTWDHFDRMFAATGTIKAVDPTHEVLLPEVWARMNDLLKERRSRLYTAQASVPGTLWTVVLLGTAVTMLTTFVLPKTPFNYVMIGVLAATMGLVFFFLMAMDRPFAGKESISPTPLQSALEQIDRWDATIASTVSKH